MKFRRSDSGQMLAVTTGTFAPVPAEKREYSLSALILDIRKFIHTWDKKFEDYIDDLLWNPARVNEAVVWGIFLHYIFPWMLDFFKVFCLFKTLTAWFKDTEGKFGASGSGMQALYKWGGAYFLFTLAPFAFELIDQASQKMYHELMQQGQKGWTPE